MGSQLEDNSASKEYRKSINFMGESFVYRTFRPWLHNDFIYNLTDNGKIYRKSLNLIENFTKNVIENRRNTFLEDPDMFEDNENV
jgi:cytochrome P450 family 4